MSIATAKDEHFDQSIIDNRAPSVARLYLDRVAESSDREAFRFPAAGGGWTSVTWGQTEQRVDKLAAGLISLGIELEQRVALACSTRYEWVIADLAVMCAGAATTTVYPTTSAEDVGYIVADSESLFVIAEDDIQVEKLRSQRDKIPAVAKVIVIDGSTDDDWVISFADLEQLGADLLAKDANAVTDRVALIEPGHLATLIYTSGTTGKPKGVRVLHSSWTYVGASIAAARLLTEEDVQYLWLPLAHSFGKMLLTMPLTMGFTTVVDGRIDKIVDNLAEIKPTFLCAVPRIFEKAYGRITTLIISEGGIKAKLFGWATGVGRQAAQLKIQGKPVTGLLSVKLGIADKLVLSKVRDRFGGRLRFFISGSAALNQDVAQWFYAADVLILEGYGLTETSAATFVNRPTAYEFGTVGWPIPGTEVKIGEDGEVLIKGPGVMDGYHNLPEATAEALSADGWLHTGDIGNLDERGFLRITDRKKDLFKTSGGKYVAPSAIEAMFKGVCPYASQLVVHGEDRNFVSALITLDEDAIAGWANENGLAGSSYAEIVMSDKAREMVQGYIDELNGKLNRWETVKKFVILDRDLSVEEGELTPSLKLKRKVVAQKFSNHLDGMYAG